ncbi:MAG TPA: GNAT family N-acetyltransferase [Acetobacteraceae bacterium]|jgi:GNAT superfamily N-acetyltransferase|nr:GNAT family N-acetyltransferase [Acetobacteraceae bacterium]
MDENSIMLRELVAEDAASAVAVIHAAFATIEAMLDPPASAARETAAGIAAWIGGGGGGGAVAVAGGTVIAVVLWTERDGGLYIARLAVRPDWRRRGLARRLLVRAEQAARAKSLPRLHLGTRLVLAGNRRLFASAGFAEIAEHAHAGYGRPTWVEMEKRLACPAMPSGETGNE